jgi:hypothetical protein
MARQLPATTLEVTQIPRAPDACLAGTASVEGLDFVDESVGTLSGRRSEEYRRVEIAAGSTKIAQRQGVAREDAPTGCFGEGGVEGRMVMEIAPQHGVAHGGARIPPGC